MKHLEALDGFIPGLRPRGHEETAGIDLVEVQAALPRRDGYEPGEGVPILDEDAVARSSDAEMVERLSRSESEMA